jgi:hypothetical protein
VLAELYEILLPMRKPIALIDQQRLWDIDCTLVFPDFITHVPMLRDMAKRRSCARRLGPRALRSFLERRSALPAQRTGAGSRAL